MSTETEDSIWIRHLPRSKMRYPRRLVDRAKYVLWRAYTPAHPLVHGAARTLGLKPRSFGVHTERGRQNFHLGYIAPHIQIQKFVNHMVAQGFANHFVAWKDESELVSLRRVENFTYQYHIRIFKDGEVRGHYEYTPECYPMSHIRAIGQEDRPQEFARMFGAHVVSRGSKGVVN